MFVSIPEKDKAVGVLDHHVSLVVVQLGLCVGA